MCNQAQTSIVLNKQALGDLLSCLQEKVMPPVKKVDFKAELARLQRENEKLKKQLRPALVTLKVASKGGVSVYGLMRFPITFYKEQWLRLLDMSDEIRAFIKENEALLKVR